MDNPYRNPDGSFNKEALRERSRKILLEKLAVAALPAAATLCVHSSSYQTSPSSVAEVAMEIARKLAKHLGEVK